MTNFEVIYVITYSWRPSKELKLLCIFLYFTRLKHFRHIDVQSNCYCYFDVSCTKNFTCINFNITDKCFNCVIDFVVFPCPDNIFNNFFSLLYISYIFKNYSNTSLFFSLTLLVLFLFSWGKTKFFILHVFQTKQRHNKSIAEFET